MKSIIIRIKSSIKEFIDVIYLMFSAITSFVTKWNTGGKIIFQNVVKQILFTGIDGTFVIGITGVVIGAIVTIILLSLPFPVEITINFHGIILTLVIIRELGPLITALVIISKSGTAIATEIGNMNANKEFDALNSMGIDVTHYVITPRILGLTLATFCLSIYLCFLSVITSAVIYNFNKLSYNIFFHSFFESLEFNDIFLSFIKSIGFGLIISAISCFQGSYKNITFTEVPKILSKSTGKCITWCFVYYAFITVLSYI